MRVYHAVRSNYQEQLVEGLIGAGVDALMSDTWGLYLPDHIHEIVQLNPDIIHLHWPESLCGFEADYPRNDNLLLALEKALDQLCKIAPLAYTMHNLQPHAQRDLDFWQKMYQLYAERAHLTVHHSRSGQMRACERFHFTGVHAVLPHGLLLDGLDASITQEQAREKLGWLQDTTIYWHFGSIRPDKNVVQLIEWAAQRDSNTEFLYLCGACNGEGLGNEVRQAAAAIDNVFFEEGHVADEDAPWQARAADYLVYNYGDVNLTSGSPHVSQALLIPQITVASEYSMEILGEAALYYDGEADRIAGLNNCANQHSVEQHERMLCALRQQQKDFRWSQIAEKYRTVYQEILNETK